MELSITSNYEDLNLKMKVHFVCLKNLSQEDSHQKLLQCYSKDLEDFLNVREVHQYAWWDPLLSILPINWLFHLFPLWKQEDDEIQS